jgi:hypothetical protein
LLYHILLTTHYPVVAYQVVGFVGVALLAAAVTADGRDVQHACAELDECAPGVGRD